MDVLTSRTGLKSDQVCSKMWQILTAKSLSRDDVRVMDVLMPQQAARHKIVKTCTIENRSTSQSLMEWLHRFSQNHHIEIQWELSCLDVVAVHGGTIFEKHILCISQCPAVLEVLPSTMVQYPREKGQYGPIFKRPAFPALSHLLSRAVHLLIQRCQPGQGTLEISWGRVRAMQYVWTWCPLHPIATRRTKTCSKTFSKPKWQSLTCARAPSCVDVSRPSRLGNSASICQPVPPLHLGGWHARTFTGWILPNKAFLRYRWMHAGISKLSKALQISETKEQEHCKSPCGIHIRSWFGILCGYFFPRT